MCFIFSVFYVFHSFWNCYYFRYVCFVCVCIVVNYLSVRNDEPVVSCCLAASMLPPFSIYSEKGVNHFSVENPVTKIESQRADVDHLSVENLSLFVNITYYGDFDSSILCDKRCKRMGNFLFSIGKLIISTGL